jgi:Co/Zn/Cd efflux system component
VIRRFIGFEALPSFQMMIYISVLALAGNAASLFILKRSQTKEVHIRASMIFTSNDILANIGVIIAGALVYFLESKIPDLIIGAIVFFLVARGALKILRLAKK